MRVNDADRSGAFEALAAACAGREVVLFSGFGLSAGAGYRPRQDALVQLVRTSAGDWLSENSIVRAFNDGEWDLLAELVVKRSSPKTIAGKLDGLYGEARELTPELSMLRLIPFENVVTTTWDPTIERAFSEGRFNRSPVIISPNGSHGLSSLFSAKTFCIVRLSGTLRPPAPILTYDQFRELLATNQTFAKHLATLIYTKAHLFVGASAETIIKYLKVAPAAETARRVHYALLQIDDESDIRFELLRSHGVRVIPVGKKGRQEDLAAWLRKLIVAIHKNAGSVANLAHSPTGPRWQSSAVTELRLREIGPFTHLDVTFDPRWNVILGTNACGKSTILRALALGLAGAESQAAPIAHRLLKAGADRGTIEVCVGNEWTKTEIQRKDDGATLFTPSVAPAGRAVAAFGYGPLRGGLTQPVSGPQARAGYGDPAGVADLLPLIVGGADPRLFDVKQMIVNAHSRSSSLSGVSADEARANRAFIERIFSTLGELLDEHGYSFKDVDRHFDVLVSTHDGDISIDQFSQGISSTMAWMGNLVGRLTQIYDGGNAEGEPFVAILDEIDAHLHPAWQQMIREKLLQVFPRGQFIVSTHSPLIVGGSAAQQVVKLERDDDGIPGRAGLEDADLIGHTDQLLRGGAFGLTTTLDNVTVAIRNELRTLRQRSRLTPAEQSKLDKLAETLAARLPVSAAASISLEALETVRQLIAKAGFTKDQKREASAQLDRAQNRVQSPE